MSMFAIFGGNVEINVKAIVMAEKLPGVGQWRLFLLDDKVIDVTLAEFDVIRPMVADAASTPLGPMHGAFQIFPGP